MAPKKTPPRTNTDTKGRFARTNGRLRGSWWTRTARDAWGTRVEAEVKRMQTSDFSKQHAHRQGGVVGD